MFKQNLLRSLRATNNYTINSSSYTARLVTTYASNIPQTQIGFMLKGGPTRLEKVEVPVPTPKSDEVLLKVTAAGMCHSDLHELKKPVKEEYIMGHEIAGKIVQSGDDVDMSKLRIDRDYALHGPNACGKCEPCLHGFDHQCIGNKAFGVGTDGGYQEYIVANPRSCIEVPVGVSAAVAAVTTDAILTPYRALKRAKLGPHSRVLIIGLGGLGMNTVQLCKLWGAYVIAHDIRPHCLEHAGSFGADQLIREIPTDKSFNADLVVDLVGNNHTFKLAQFHTRPLGTIVPLGLEAEQLDFDRDHSTSREINLVPVYWGTSLELRECLDMVSRGMIKPETETVEFDNVDGYLQKLKRGEIASRLVFVPKQELASYG